MQFISCDGERYQSRSRAVLHTVRLKLDAFLHGRLSEFDKEMERELGKDQLNGEHFKDAWVDWLGGYVHMYNPHGIEIAAIKIDTEYYRFPESKD